MHEELEEAAAVLAKPRLFETDEDWLAAESLVSIVLQFLEPGEVMPNYTERTLLVIANKLIARSMTRN
ncbi:hypothetical protein [Pararhizobium arenae]|uniref:hypothetical protein n=1 Tax=Pararhizobium arenae TaxID=1856850 RepID=UPI00094A9E2B|nr:hypothetical protein [Pararhizobium arenae]